MAELSGLQIFKYLPAAKKEEHSNCKACGFPTCMSFALKLAKNEVEIEKCPYVPDELKGIFSHTMKKAQKEIVLSKKNNLKIGGEEVLFRHDKTFINPTVFCVVIDTDTPYESKLKRILDFEITRINENFKIDAVLLKGSNITFELINKIESKGITAIQELPKDLMKVDEDSFGKNIEKLTLIRRTAIKTKAEEFSNPTYVYLKSQNNLYDLCAKASYYLCKYANMIVFEDFDESMFASLLTLRQNIFTDPQKPLQIEPKVYEFNNPDENALIFLTTNFALTYFSVANELESIDRGAYLIVTPSDGMSVLTAWSAEKFTANIVSKAVKDSNLYDKVKIKRIFIPGLLSDMQNEIQEVVPDFEICISTTEACMMKDFIKKINEQDRENGLY
ncbi:hypothetical protein IJG72_03555 [bacterium]|nr:hypothetical protein [bacterium]